MTHEEAIERIKCILKNNSFTKADKNALKLTIEALEKQIPKKPVENRYPWTICPSCAGSVYIEKVQEHIMNNENTYCEHCGQALDWSDAE